MPTLQLSWQQVNTWRLAQHRLAPRLAQPNLVDAATQSAGIQAQVMSAAELAFWARGDGLSPRAVQDALWRRRTLVKTWMMRGALHILSAGDLPLYVAARSLYSTRNWPYFFAYYGVPQKLYEAYLDVAPEILSDQPLTREQLAAAVGERLHSPDLQELVSAKGWGTALKPLAWRGDLCFGPNSGRNVTFVRPSAWLGAWQPLEPYAALQEMARRYLNAYGPATAEDFAAWWSLGLLPARKLFRSLAGELEPVDVEGWQAVALSTTTEAMRSAAAAPAVNLLPLFDAYTLGIGRGAEIEPLLARQYQRLIYRPQGWISAVVLVDGYMRGVWMFGRQHAQLLLTVRLFSPAGAAVEQGIAAEAKRLSDFLKAEVVLRSET